MRFQLNALRVSFAVAAAGLMPLSSHAANATATLPVAATVVSTCVVAATPLVFGNYSSTTAADTEAESKVVVACTPGTAYDVALDAGQNSSSVSDRKLAGPTAGATLAYGLYRDANHSQNWGNTPGSDTITGTGDGDEQAISVYGNIPQGQVAPVGAYTDVVTVTVSY